jgi:hypothetical protein
MSYIRQYMQNARNFANETYLNADGFIDDDTNYFTGNEDYFSADGMPMASMPQASAPVSQPYIVTVSNASATTVSNFDILGAYNYINASTMASTPAGTVTFSSGNLVSVNTGGAGTGFAITVSSGIANVTYQQFLYQSMNSPFSVGMTYIQTTTANQLVQPIVVNTQDANGNQALKTLVVTIDPYQQQTGVVAVKQLYRIDGYTKLTFSVLASAVVTFQFYPADNINLARGLSGRPASRQFSKPSIVKDSVAVIGGDVVKARLG